MSYEVLLLSQEWFKQSQDPSHFQVLTEIINKGYSKPRDRFQVVLSARIQAPQYLLRDLQIDVNKHLVFAILLGSKEKLKEAERQFGYTRTFNADISQSSSCNDSDVPPEILEHLGPLRKDNIKFRSISPGKALDPEIKDRVLATVGYKALSPQEIDGSIEHEGARYYELTGFCAFGKRLGTSFLEFTIEEFFGARESPIAIDPNVPQYFICCTVIVEHDLVSYYTQACGFSKSKRPDERVSKSKIPKELETSMIFRKDFHVAFLFREVIPHDG